MLQVTGLAQTQVQTINLDFNSTLWSRDRQPLCLQSWA